MEQPIYNKFISFVRITVWISGVLIFLSFSSCKSSKKVKRNSSKVIEGVDRKLTYDNMITIEGGIKTLSLKSYQFTDSSGVQVKVPVEKVFKVDQYTVTQAERVELGETKTFEEEVSSVEKDVERGTNWVGFLLGVILILVLAILIKRSTNLLRPFSFL